MKNIENAEVEPHGESMVEVTDSRLRNTEQAVDGHVDEVAVEADYARLSAELEKVGAQRDQFINRLNETGLHDSVRETGARAILDVEFGVDRGRLLKGISLAT